jgi:hypothetical protein
MANATFLYAGTRQGLAIASKPGTSPDWHLTRQALADRPVQALALGAEIPVRVVAAITGAGLFHSANNGRDWLLTLPQAVGALLADPLAPEQMYAGLSDADPAIAPGVAAPVMASADGGQTWAALAPLPATGTRVTALALTAGEGGSRRLWAGLESGGVVHLALPPLPPPLEEEGESPAPLVSPSPSGEGAAWRGGILGLPAKEPILALGAVGGEDLFVATPDGFYLLVGGQRAGDGAWKGTDRVWRRQDGVPPDLLLFAPVGRAAGPGSGALLAADRVGRLWRGDNGGTTWAELPLPPGADQATALAAHPEYPDRAYLAGSSGRIFESKNRGTAWDDTGLLAGGPVTTLGIVVIK